MKLNNKGFAISTIMYIILIMGVILITLTLSLLSSRKLILDKTKHEALNNIYETKQSRLPSEYQEVEYIESSGTQEISNFYQVPGTYTTIEFETRTNTSSSSEQGIIGIANKLELAYSSTTNRIALWDSTSGPLAYVSASNVRGNNIILKATLSNENLKTLYTSLDNGQTVTSSTNYTSINDSSVDLFAYKGSNSYYFKGKLYYAKVRVDNELVRYMIPCYRKSDNVIGMYDLINDVFYINTGTGTFSKGNDVI